MAFRGSFRATSSVNVASLDVPSASVGSQTTDVVVCALGSDGTGATLTMPSGSTVVTGFPITLTLDGHQANVSTKYESGSPPTNYTFSLSPSKQCVAVVAAYSGRDSATPTQTSAVHNSTSSASPRDLVATGITPANTGADIVMVAIPDWSSNNAQSFTNPTNYTEREDSYNGDWVSVGLFDRVNQPASATGSITAVGTCSSSSATDACALISLEVVAGGGLTFMWVPVTQTSRGAIFKTMPAGMTPPVDPV